jgi:hypothetical protein
VQPASFHDAGAERAKNSGKSGFSVANVRLSALINRRPLIDILL